jgi:hypothetical protein
MGEFFTALLGGAIIACFNRFILSGDVCKWLTPEIEDDDGQSSTSTFEAEIHMHH